MSLRIALIDCYDSYTHNLSHLLARVNAGVPPTTILADAYLSLPSLLKHHPPFDAYILSPGPGTPTNPIDFPSLPTDILRSNLPTLAVCLGHQALCHLAGASIIRAPSGPAHGIESIVHRTTSDCPLFRNLPPSFSAVRYHSLVPHHQPLPSVLLPTAWTVDPHPTTSQSLRVLMAVRHRHIPHFGLQFHPESIASQFGLTLAANFLTVVANLRHVRTIPRPISQPIVNPCPTFHTLVHRIPSPTCEGTHVLFESMFARHHTPAFWLDSSTADLSNLRLPSPTTAHLPVESKSALPRGRFSVMGPFDGPLAELVTYDVSQQTVSVKALGRDAKSNDNVEGTIFDYLQKQLGERYASKPTELPIDLNGGYIGFFGYELKRDVHGVRTNVHTSSLPDAWWVFADRLLVIDHHNDDVFLIALVPIDDEFATADAEKWFNDMEDDIEALQTRERHSGNGLEFCNGSPITMFNRDDGSKLISSNARIEGPLSFTLERGHNEYIKDIESVLEHILDGDTYEVCLTNRLRSILPPAYDIDPFALYCLLRNINPAPYSAFLRLDATTSVCCSSPERFLRVSSTGNVESKPIKGTLKRGDTVKEDELLREQLRTSTKDRSENLMIVDLVRNDLSRTCRVGSVVVPKLMQVESFATVHQLVSTVQGDLADGNDTVSCIREAYPMGSMTGAPKVRTMEIIDHFEHSARGLYSGSIGFLAVCGAADLNVVIRTAVLRGPKIEIGVGGAIVALSDPEMEFDEIMLKGSAIMKAIAMLTTGSNEYKVSNS